MFGYLKETVFKELKERLSEYRVFGFPDEFYHIFKEEIFFPLQILLENRGRRNNSQFIL